MFHGKLMSITSLSLTQYKLCAGYAHCVYSLHWIIRRTDMRAFRHEYTSYEYTILVRNDAQTIVLHIWLYVYDVQYTGIRGNWSIHSTLTLRARVRISPSPRHFCPSASWYILVFNRLISRASNIFPGGFLSAALKVYLWYFWQQCMLSSFTEIHFLKGLVLSRNKQTVDGIANLFFGLMLDVAQPILPKMR